MVLINHQPNSPQAVPVPNRVRSLLRLTPVPCHPTSLLTREWCSVLLQHLLHFRFQRVLQLTLSRYRLLGALRLQVSRLHHFPRFITHFPANCHQYYFLMFPLHFQYPPIHYFQFTPLRASLLGFLEVFLNPQALSM